MAQVGCTYLPTSSGLQSPAHGIVCLPCLSPADACLNFQLISFHFIFAVKKLQAALAQAVSDRCVYLWVCLCVCVNFACCSALGLLGQATRGEQIGR